MSANCCLGRNEDGVKLARIDFSMNKVTINFNMFNLFMKDRIVGDVERYLIVKWSFIGWVGMSN